MIAHRPAKAALYNVIAQVAQAAANPHRLELLDLLVQAPRSVEQLAEASALSIANASQHLQRLKQAGLVPSTSEAMRLIEQGGVRIDGAVVSDKALKVGAGTCVVQIGKRKFARVTLAA